MFPEEHANHTLQHDKQDNEAPSLRAIVRQETDDGRLIVRFFVSTMQGQLQDAKPSHRIAAARQLVKLGFTEAQDFIDENAPDPKRRRRAHHSPPADRKLASGLAKIVRQETDDGRVAVRFLVDVMRGGLPGFKPHHRLAAARELLRRGFDDTLADDNAGHSDDDAVAPADPPDDYDYGKCGIYHYDGRGNMLTCEAVNCPYVTRGRRSVKPVQGEPSHSHISVADASRSGYDHSCDRAADTSPERTRPLHATEPPTPPRADPITPAAERPTSPRTDPTTHATEPPCRNGLPPGTAPRQTPTPHPSRTAGIVSPSSSSQAPSPCLPSADAGSMTRSCSPTPVSVTVQSRGKRVVHVGHQSPLPSLGEG